jgi:hypothetical protein
LRTKIKINCQLPIFNYLRRIAVAKKDVQYDNRRVGFKGEMVEEKDLDDMDPAQSYKKKNPYKTPPNNMTTKRGFE